MRERYVVRVADVTRRPARVRYRPKGYVGAPELPCTDDDHWLLVRSPLLTGAQDGRHRSRRACASRPFRVRQVVPRAALKKGDSPPRGTLVSSYFLFSLPSDFRRTERRREPSADNDSWWQRRRASARPRHKSRSTRARTRARVSLRRSTCRRAQSPGNTAPVASAPSRSNRRAWQQFVRCFEPCHPSPLVANIPLSKQTAYFVTGGFFFFRRPREVRATLPVGSIVMESNCARGFLNAISLPHVGHCPQRSWYVFFCNTDKIQRFFM